jgi:glucose-6-phosphate-specific signal transduction histidine kinase
MSDQPTSPVDPELVRFGLSRAIQIHSEEFRTKNPQIKIDLDLVEDEKLLPQSTCLVLYQVYLECLEISRRARAGMVWVRYYPLWQQMVLEIKHNGTGLGPRLDLTRLEECIQPVGGQVKATTLPAGGMVLAISVPMK